MSEFFGRKSVSLLKRSLAIDCTEQDSTDDVFDENKENETEQAEKITALLGKVHLVN